MKLDLDTSNLDWSKATVRDYRYIHHLMKMIHERWTQLGMCSSYYAGVSKPCELVSNKENVFNLCRYSPGGILTWDQLSSIYHAMVFLGLYVYFNEKNFDEKYWKNGDNRKLYCFSLKDMCEIAEFDFFANPFIPGQPIDYYSKFLYPIKKVLSEYKKIASIHYILPRHLNTSNKFDSPVIVAERAGLAYSIVELPKKVVNGQEYQYEGQDALDFLKNPKNYLNRIEEFYNCYKNNIEWTHNSHPKSPRFFQNFMLGYEYVIQTIEVIGSNYGQDKEYSYYSDLVCGGFGVSFGSLFKCAELWPAGIKYDVFLCHTTFCTVDMVEANYEFYIGGHVTPKYFNSPWPMIIKSKSGTVPANNIVEEWIELPSWSEIPTSYPYSKKDEKWTRRYRKDGQQLSETNPKTNPFWHADHYAAFYYPMFVFDVSSLFQYN